MTHTRATVPALFMIRLQCQVNDSLEEITNGAQLTEGRWSATQETERPRACPERVISHPAISPRPATAVADSGDDASLCSTFAYCIHVAVLIFTNAATPQELTGQCAVEFSILVAPIREGSRTSLPLPVFLPVFSQSAHLHSSRQ